MWTIPIGQNNCPYVHFLRGYKIKKGQFINITKNKTHNCEDPKKRKKRAQKSVQVLMILQRVSRLAKNTCEACADC